MADPQPPNIPADAPQDVKDFFECKGDKLVWKKGKVSWLTIKVSDDVEVTPEISFEHGKAAGSVQISVSLAGISGTVGASVNAEGQLVIDDVSLLLKPFKDKIDDAAKTINDWFKHNKKKLKPAVLKKGEVTLEKTATTIGYAPPAVMPFDEDENQNKPENVGLTPGVAAEEWDLGGGQTTVGPAAISTPGAVQSSGPRGVSILLLVFLGLAVLGLGIGFVFFGGLPVATVQPSLVAAASPTVPPSASPRATPSPSPSSSPSPSNSAAPSVSTSPSVQPVLSVIDRFCAHIVHEAIGNYVSQIQLGLTVITSGLGADRIEILLQGANDDQPAVLEVDPETGAYVGYSGLHEPGPKSIMSVKGYHGPNVVVDLTQDLIDYLGTDEILVRYPEEDSFGDCSSPSP